MRSGASVSQLLAVRSVPVAARTSRILWRGLSVMAGSPGSACEGGGERLDALQNVFQVNAQACGLVRVQIEGGNLRGQMAHLGELHLDGVHAGFRLAVMARRPAALEAAIEDAGIAFSLRAGLERRRFDFLRAGAPHVGADIEVRQP